MTHGFGTITYNYNIAMNYLTEYKEDANNDGIYELSVQYDYSKQGNPKYKAFKDVGRSNAEIARETYTWNDRDELVAVSGRVTNNFVYDYKGLRAKTNAAKYLYLQNSQPAFKYNVSDNYYDVFVYEGSKRIARVRINSMGTATKETFINDYQGSPVAVIADDQTIKYQQYNDPWGNMEMSVGVPTSNPEFKYTDKELDEDSGLYYFQARYYDPMGGRFLGRDEVGIEQDLINYFQLNSYQFTDNNPIKHIDNDGKYKIQVITGKDNTGFAKVFAEDGTFFGKYEIRTLGSSAKQGVHDPSKTDNDTPEGIYKITGWAGGNSNTAARPNDPDKKSYGTGVLYLVAKSGEALNSGRTGIWMHGGGNDKSKKIVKDPYADQQGWLNTHGCFRLQNEDINDLINNTIPDVVKYEKEKGIRPFATNKEGAKYDRVDFSRK